MQSATPTTTMCATAATHGSTSTKPEKRSLPPFLRLPHEIILRIFAFTARQGVPSDLAHLRATSTTFYTLLSDSQQNETKIWRRAAVTLLDTCIPSTLTLEPTWQEFVKRTWRFSKPPLKPQVFDDESCSLRDLARDHQLYTQLYTSHGGPCSPPIPLVSDTDISVFQRHAENLQWTKQLLPSVPEGAKRIIDFVHSGTEGSRSEIHGTPYSGANVGLFFTFVDDPMAWSDVDQRVQRGFVSRGGSRMSENEIEVSGVQDLQGWWTTDKSRFGDTPRAESSYVSWARSCVHSDANLNLVPRVIRENTVHFAIGSAIVERVDRYSAPNVIDKTWDFTGGYTAWMVKNEKNDSQMWQGPWARETNWEFRSGGDYLAICDDNDSGEASTITCFASGKCATPLWQREMTGQDTDIMGNTREFFYDNDGIRMNTAFVAYATRAKRTADRHLARSDPSNRTAMEFILLSTKTGDILRVLRLPQEDRPMKIDMGFSLCLWCSFVLTDTLLVATVGGRNSTRDADNHFQYLDALIWDLAASSRTSAPTHAIRLPKRWDATHESYPAISPDGRWLGIQVDWELVVYDLEKRNHVGVWRATRAANYGNQEIWDVGERIAGWNGLWIKYRDVFESSSTTSPSQEISAASPSTPSRSLSVVLEKEHAKPSAGEEHHVTFLTSRVLRRIFERHEELRQRRRMLEAHESLGKCAGQPLNLSYFPCIDDGLISDSEYEEDEDDGDDGDDDAYFEYFDEVIDYESGDDDDIDDEMNMPGWMLGAPQLPDNEWEETDETIDGGGATEGTGVDGHEIKTVYATDGEDTEPSGSVVVDDNITGVYDDVSWDDEESGSGPGWVVGDAIATGEDPDGWGCSGETEADAAAAEGFSYGDGSDEEYYDGDDDENGEEEW